MYLRSKDCAKHDPEVTEDAEKNFAELLKEELQLREAEALENQRRADLALLEAKKMTSQYQKEADKCNSGMETCEEAREKAEATLAAQKKLTAMWELRARRRGWKDGVAEFHAQSQGKCSVLVKDLLPFFFSRVLRYDNLFALDLKLQCKQLQCIAINYSDQGISSKLCCEHCYDLQHESSTFFYPSNS
ncbi:hypothetical protein OIU79_020060 [Salix purpurea]|uniref:Uncharacterized protein n=1 Tax=Salix purpurea TaxID=77065 RepID=A0A9Q0SKQ9_SALPP|nr:hypothetical protein OIU79_020060 [Salix purpurea]